MMDKIRFQIDIKADALKVWQTLWNEKSYKEWTAAFGGGGSIVTDWKEGSTVLFLSEDGSGIEGIIEQNIEGSQMSFLHKVEIKNGVRTIGDWSDARESYQLSSIPKGTRLDVQMDVLHAYLEYFNDTFPKALLTVKKMAESEQE